MRRWMTAFAFCCALAGFAPALAAAETAPVRIGITPVFLHDQTALVHAWRGYLETRLKRPVVITQRATYREITELLRHGKLDFAWICGYPFVTNRTHLNLLAVPLYRGKPSYRAYLIVPASDDRTTSVTDLRDKVFAFSDPDSNSGYLVPVHELLRHGEKSGTFFRKAFFTWSHRKVVEAVAAGLAQGGSVDGYVWDMLALQDPHLTARTRIASESMEFSFPPFVAGKAVAPSDVHAMRAVLLGMSQDVEGEMLLRRLRLDGFVPGSDAMFDDIRRMMRTVTGE